MFCRLKVSVQSYCSYIILPQSQRYSKSSLRDVLLRMHRLCNHSKRTRPPRSKFLRRSTKGCLIRAVGKGIYRYYDFTRKCFDTSHNLYIKELQYPSSTDFIHLLPPEIRPQRTESQPTQKQPLFDTIAVQPAPPIAALSSTINPTVEPTTFEEALQSPEAKLWIEAMIEEIRYTVDNHAFFLCDLPPGRKSIGCKWVYKIKRNANNTFERCRARIVAKGYSQVDFDKTYAPVVRIRHIFALAAFYGLYILHADAKTAFVNGNSDVELFFRYRPNGFAMESTDSRESVTCPSNTEYDYRIRHWRALPSVFDDIAYRLRLSFYCCDHPNRRSWSRVPVDYVVSPLSTVRHTVLVLGSIGLVTRYSAITVVL